LLKVAVETQKKILPFYIAFGSANELEYQLLLSIDLKFIDNESGQKLLFQVEEIKKC
jgi:four helix bundle protein